jgi:hypothetical protein
MVVHCGQRGGKRGENDVHVVTGDDPSGVGLSARN